MRAQLTLAAALLLPLLLACGPAPPAAPAAGDPAAAGAAAPTNRIAIPPTVRRNLGITFAPVEVRHVAQTIRVPGAFELRPRARREYRMALPGRVELHVDQYERVEAGQLLYRFQSPAWPELQHEILAGEQGIDTGLAEVAVAKAKAAETRRRIALVRGRVEALAQAEFKRADLEAEAAELEAGLPRLEAEIALAETRLENARRTRLHALHRAATATGLALEELQAEVDAGEGRPPYYEALDWIEVTAAEAGVVESLAVTDGAFVEPPDAVLATVDPGRVRFRALALQADLPRLAGAVGAAGARIVPPRSPGIPLGEAAGATLDFGLEAHPEERTLTLLAVPEAHAPWMRPGVSAFLEVVTDATAQPALAIPRAAVVQDGLTHVFFRRDPADPNQGIRVEADLGLGDGRWVVVKSGVVRGDEVVLDGAYELKLATQASGGAAAEGGHFHADGSFHGDH